MDYDAWKCGWYDCEPTTHCKHCEYNEQTLDEAKEFLEEVVQQLYSTDSLDIYKLEHCLDELCHMLKVKMNAGDIQVERKEKIKIFSRNLIKLNNDMLKNLTQAC